jgi:uncharacterized membrane protein YeaQ/YmgE (transglycosylase-associated protein family)
MARINRLSLSDIYCGFLRKGDMSGFYAIASAVLILALFALGWANNSEEAPFLVIVLAFGALGAVVREHVYLRFQRQSQDFRAPALMASFFCPVVGAMLALILITLFLSEVVSGDLFPKFEHTKDAFTSMKSVLRGSVSFSTNADFYKMLAWSFMAGYAEKFILSKLDGLAGQGQAGKPD